MNMPNKPIKPPSLLDGDAEVDILVKWSDLKAHGQNHIIQEWLTGPHDKFSVFCSVHGLNYKSFHKAFTQRDLFTARESLKKDPTVLINWIESAEARIVDYDKCISAVLSTLFQKIVTAPMPIELLMSLSQRLSTDRQKFGLQIAEVMQATAAMGVSEASQSIAKNTSTALPPSLQEELRKRLGVLGEAIVKDKESKK